MCLCQRKQSLTFQELNSLQLHGSWDLTRFPLDSASPGSARDKRHLWCHISAPEAKTTRCVNHKLLVATCASGYPESQGGMAPGTSVRKNHLWLHQERTLFLHQEGEKDLDGGPLAERLFYDAECQNPRGIVIQTQRCIFSVGLSARFHCSFL